MGDLAKNYVYSQIFLFLFRIKYQMQEHKPLGPFKHCAESVAFVVADLPGVAISPEA